MSTTFEQHGDIAVITMDNPPVNGLSHALRSKIVAGIHDANAKASVKAIILMGSSRAFSGGADIREFNTPAALAEPNLPYVVATVEQSAKPVIAAIGGACMGGGLELALGCHVRIALADAQIALPEVKLGLLPGAGGTQRLPRLVGVETALNMIVSGEAVPAQRLAASGLFDEICEGNLFESALSLANRIVKEGKPLRRTRDLNAKHPQAEAYFQFCRNTIGAMSRNFPAPLKCVEAVAAAVQKPFEEGLRVEQGLFQHLVGTPESKALRHAFFAERAAAKLADVAESTKPRDIRKVGIIGAGTMGGGIAMAFLNAGLAVTLLELKQEALDKGVGVIRKNYDSSVQKGKLKREDVDARLALLATSLTYEGLKDADLIIEAVFEDMDVKQQVFKKLDQVAKPGAILASNTSTLDVDKIASFTSRPQDVIGLHFFSPAHVMKLLEVVRGAKTADDVLMTAMTLAKKIKKTAVVSGVCDGFIGNRMIGPYGTQALRLLEEGASPQQVDRALEAFGMAMGPFRMGDLSGNDIGWAIRKRQLETQPDPHYPRIADRLCELGRFGQKTGAGWYSYTAGSRDAQVDPAVDKLIAAYRSEKGLKTRVISDQEIVERCIFALINEGARILDEGIAQRASDIDMVYLSGYGFPLHRGGPMFYADQVGLYRVAQQVGHFHAQTGDAFWQPAKLLSELAASGRSFNI